MAMTISGTSGITYPDSTTQASGSQACKAWVNFNGTGVVAIRAQYNVTSITDNGTGNYTVNFTNTLSDANYATNVTAGGVTIGRQPITSASVNSSGNTVAPTTAAFTFNLVTASVTQSDADYLNVVIFR